MLYLFKILTKAVLFMVIMATMSAHQDTGIERI